jgi:tRNA1(Val) A37 N6-methylase TrmN6
LGGTIKIAEQIAENAGEEDVAGIICEELQNIEGKTIFGISAYFAGDKVELSKWCEDLGKQIKREIKQSGKPVRYVFNREPILSSVTVSKNGLDKKGREFLISKSAGGYALAKTIAVQPFEEWGARDFGRPGRDDLSGMLPPKLARMMINLSGANTGSALLDPFCGSGTILSEAMLLGFSNVTGTDISDKAIADTKNNISWAEKTQNMSAVGKPNGREIKIFQEDVQYLTKKIKPGSIDAIITEPYLGKPLKGRESEAELRSQTAELKTLYLAAFEQFTRLLKSGGMVVFIVPCFKLKNGWLKIDINNELKKLSFSPSSLIKIEGRDYASLLYARSDQRVGREIWKFIRQ